MTWRNGRSLEPEPRLVVKQRLIAHFVAHDSGMPEELKELAEEFIAKQFEVMALGIRELEQAFFRGAKAAERVAALQTPPTRPKGGT